MLGALAGALTEAALAQPNIRPRVVVSWGPVNKPVNETALAASYCTDHYELVALWNIGDKEALGYAVSHNGGETWNDRGQMPIPDDCSGSTTFDPTVAVDPDTGDFVGGGATTCACDPPPGDVVHVFVGRKACSADDFDPNSAVRLEHDEEHPCCLSDFPHIASGPGPGAQGSYLYITSHTGLGVECPNALCLHTSDDGGQSWSRRTRITDVLDHYGVPAVASDGTLNIAYDAPGHHISFLQSDDGGVSFSDPVNCAVRENTSLNNGDYVAGTFPIKRAKSMAVDPSNPDKLYIVFDDLDELPDPNEDGDVDVFLLKSTDGGEHWSNRVRINNDTPNVQHDQFFPAVTVDTNGWVHVIWYDTRLDPQPHDAEHVKIGLYYGRSTDGGATFTNYKIGYPTINTRYLLSPGFIGDYNSITMAGDTVVAVYMGTYVGFTGPGEAGGSKPDDETIFCSRILWE